jgi:hypothetical protein
MGFVRVHSDSNQDGFVDILRSVSPDSLELEGNTEKVERIIDAFKDGRWRQKVET